MNHDVRLLSFILNPPQDELSARQSLKTLLPMEVIAVVYSREWDPYLSPALREIRKKFPRSQDLFAWLYESRSLGLALQFVRLPSASKRAVVTALVTHWQHRYRWASSQLLHAFAFAPEYFKQRPGGGGYGPLYVPRSLPKGRSGRRTLYVPNAPLRRLQKCVLRLLLDPALQGLPWNVMGCRPADPAGERSYGVYPNAAAHLGQQFVASFDLRDFFPSITVNDVVPTLLRLNTPAIVVPGEPGPGETQSTPRALPWTMDLAVLIARLCTYRGRLPQGAPTSPALANLVFAEYDRRIAEHFGPQFVYTRYVDDLTLSLSKAAAASLGLCSAREMLRFVEPRLQAALAGSRFTLNPTKTRVSTVGEGHSVTGLRVTESSVELPRAQKRALRALLCGIQKHGIVKIAVNAIGGEIHARTAFVNRHRGHTLAGRRMATEKLAALMLRSQHPDLRIEIPEAVVSNASRRIKRPPDLHEGKKAIRSLERVLSALWKGKLSTELDGHLNIKNPDGTVLCRVRSDGELGFLELSRREALAVTELWHRLNGWQACLVTKDNDACYAPLRAWRERIRKVLEGISIRASDRLAIPAIQATDEPADVGLTPEDQTRQVLRELYEALQEFHEDACPTPLTNDALQLVPKLTQPVASPDEFKEWIEAAHQLCIDEHPQLPGMHNEGQPGANKWSPFEVLHIFYGRVREERAREYKCVAYWLNNAVRKHFLDEVAEGDWLAIQRRVGQLLCNAFRVVLQRRAQMSPDGWRALLKPNVYLDGVEKSIEAAYLRFVKAHHDARWPGVGKPIFSNEARLELERNAGALHDPVMIRSPSNREAWEALCEFAKVLVKCTTDALAAKEGMSNDETLKEFKKAMTKEEIKVWDVIYAMRNRAAHPPSRKRRDEWKFIQTTCADWLDRRGPRRPEGATQRMHGPDDLVLTVLEVNELKAKILSELAASLEKCRAQSG